MGDAIKMKLETKDLVAENVQKIANLFPNCVTEKETADGRLEKAINWKMLKQMLKGKVIDGEEAYEFSWVGKKAAIVEANKPIRKTLRPCKEESKNWDTTENLYIEGDNLEALKLLQESYLGKVKMIYIDPPYNTGHDFIYNDTYTISNDEYAENIEAVDDNGYKMFKNTDTNGRFHSAWCSKIYSCLLLARNLLTKDGIIFISIDDREESNLREICDELFGNINFVGSVILKTATDNNPRQIYTEHEYILCYSREKNLLSPWYSRNEKAMLIKDEYLKLKSEYEDDVDRIQEELRLWIKKNKKELKGVTHYDNVDEKGVFHDGDIANTTFGGYEYDVIHPVTGKVCKMPAKGYRFPETTYEEMRDNGDIVFGDDETTLIKPKKRLENAKDVLRSIIYEDGRSSTKKFENLLDRDVFSNPKSTTVLARIFNFVLSENDIVIDFYSGSASTAEAILELNVEHNKNVKYIMVQIPSDLDVEMKKSDAKEKKTIKNAIAFLDNIGKRHTICEIGKERIRRAGDKIMADNADKEGIADLDIGFRVLKVDSSNMNDVYYGAEDYSQQLLLQMENNIKSDRTELDLLFGCIVDWGLELSCPYASTEIEGYIVHNYNDGDLVACFAENIPESVIKAIAKMEPMRAVFRDSGFADSPAKINVTEIFKRLSPDTDVRVI